MGLTKIEWTHYSFNAWWGCTKISPGCKHCYAERQTHRWHGKGFWGDAGERRFFSDNHWKKPEAWNRKAEREGVRFRVFTNSMADVFEDRPDLVEPRERLFELIRRTPNLDWLLLTKRAENFATMLPWIRHPHPGEVFDIPWGEPWPNVWLGVSVEDQARADERIPWLLETPAAVRFVSYEPALGPVDFSEYLDPAAAPCGETNDVIDWIIAGSESGPRARPADLEWYRRARDQCQTADVSFFLKQLCIDGAKIPLPYIDGQQWAEFPTV